VINMNRGSVVIGLIILLDISIVQAYSIENISFQDLDNDLKPDLAVIRTDFAQGNDTILVFDQDGDMIETHEWKACCDFDNDIWIFDAGSDGKADLIINFSKMSGEQIAYLYDDQTGNGDVSYSVKGKDINITESPYWTLKIVAKDGWWIDDGKVNFNVEILGDGRVIIHGMDKPYLDRGDYKKENDGIIDFKINVYDVEKKGIPSYELRQSFPNVPETKGIIGRTLLIENVDGDEAPIQDYIFWPYLGSGYYLEKKYNEGPPPIRVDWKTAKIVSIAEFIASRMDEGNYFIYSINELKKNETNYLNFENPFAFYDLANDNDGYPELQVRIEYYRSNDFVWRGGKDQNPFMRIRYSWDQDNNNLWDYKVDLVGNYSIDSVVEFQDFSVITIPYEELPTWILDRNWNAVSFTSVEKPGYRSSEGIYEDGSTIGFRSDINANFSGIPYIYFSPIDNKLHLLNAREGIWTIDQTQKIKYQNLDGDAYIDEWVFFVNDKPYKHLIYNNNFLIYSDEEKIKLMKTKIDQSLFESLPPRNHQEWKYLKNLLDKYKKSIDPKDLKALFNQFSGDCITIENGFLSDFRLLDKGFKFILECISTCKIDSFMEIDYEKPLTEGKYLFVYDGRFFIRKWIEPDLIIKPIDIVFSNANPVELNYITIAANIHNIGMRDLGHILVQFFNGNPDSGGVLISNQTIPLISSGEVGSASVQWLATIESNSIYVIVDPYNSILESNKTNNIAFRSIKVSPLKQASALERLMIGTEKSILAFIFLILIGMICVTLYIVKLIFD